MFSPTRLRFLFLLSLSFLLLAPFWVSAQERISDLSPSPLFHVISPLASERAEGRFVVVVRPAESVSLVTVSFGTQSLSLSSDSSWSGVLDSSSLPNGSADLVFESCLRDRCDTQTIPVLISNSSVADSSAPSRKRRRALTPSEPSPSLPSVDSPLSVTVSLPSLPSLSTFALPSGRVVARSSGDPVSLSPGSYDVLLDFINAPVSRLSLSSVAISESGPLARFRLNVPVLPFSVRSVPFESVSSVFVDLGFDSRSQRIFFPAEEDSRVFYCSSFAFDRGSCSVSWLPASLEGDFLVSDWEGRSGMFVRARRSSSISPSASLISLSNVPGDYFASTPFSTIGPLDESAYLFPHDSYALRLSP
ncbi:MAG: hypothetical protein AABY11_03335, partial [archaeon]